MHNFRHLHGRASLGVVCDPVLWRLEPPSTSRPLDPERILSTTHDPPIAVQDLDGWPATHTNQAHVQQAGITGIAPALFTPSAAI